MNQPLQNTGASVGDRPSLVARRITVVYGITAFILVLVIGQIWLVTATVNSFLGGNVEIVLPAASASVVSFLLNLGLLRFLNRV